MAKPNIRPRAARPPRWTRYLRVVEGHWACACGTCALKKKVRTGFLRVLIDRDEPLDTDTCEAVSRAIDPLLDAADPIDQSYYLEVGSPRPWPPPDPPGAFRGPDRPEMRRAPDPSPTSRAAASWKALCRALPKAPSR